MIRPPSQNVKTKRGCFKAKKLSTNYGFYKLERNCGLIEKRCGFFGGKGSSEFSSNSTAEQVTQGVDATGLTAIITGASSGIGMETARVLALHGVHVIMAVRNVDAGRKVKDNILEEVATAKIDVMKLDPSSMASVRQFALEYKSLCIPLNILINNAGVLLSKYMLSEDNIELHFATNHLGHFLLTNLLLETMKTTASQSQVEGRIINVSSSGHWVVHPKILFDKINDDRMFKYGPSKLANILHANELARRLKEEGVDITANSLHPGAVMSTNIARDWSIVNGKARGDCSFLNGLLNFIGRCLCKSVQQGGATTCYVALHPQVKGVTGENFSDCKIGKPSCLARDSELAKKLWDFSLTLTDPIPNC